MKFETKFKDIFYIYKITNSLNNNIYIGRSKVPKYRFRQHLSNSNDPSKSLKSQKIHYAIKELGHENFTFEVFEECKNYFDACIREKYWIDFYESDKDGYGYNDVSGPNEGENYLTDEGRIKLSKRMSGSNNPMFGKEKSPETLAKMRLNSLGEKNPFYGKKHTVEAKIIIGIASSGRAAGENNSNSKLNLENVNNIREDWKTGLYTKVDLSKKYNVTATTIGNILAFKSWK